MGHGTRATPTTSLTTTAGFTEHTRLWRLRFNAANDPAAGGRCSWWSKDRPASPAGKLTADSQATTAMGPSLSSWGPLRATTRSVPDYVSAGFDRQVHPLRRRPALCGPVRPRSPGR